VLDITKWFGETSGGVKTYLLQKAAYVAARPELRHTLVIPGARDEIAEGEGVRVYRLRGPRIPTQTAYRFIFATRSIARIVSHECPGVIEVGSPFVVPWLTAKAARPHGVPLVSFYHGSVVTAVRAIARGRFVGDAGAAFGTWYLRRLDRLFERTIAASDYAVAELQRAGVERVVRVPLGVDLDRFHPALRDQRQEVRRDLGIPDGPVGAYVGRLHREKALDVLLDAWRDVSRRTGATLVIAGDGPERARLQARAAGMRVRWIPHVADRGALARLHAAVNLLVAPGPSETFGLAALEALACGTPVLSASEGGVAEHVQRSGAGASFRSGDAGSLAEAAVALFRGDLEAMGRLGRAHAEREHSWQRTFDRLFDVYRSVA
jgi:alpha-1,6-mannosyltransferase